MTAGGAFRFLFGILEGYSRFQAIDHCILLRMLTSQICRYRYSNLIWDLLTSDLQATFSHEKVSSFLTAGTARAAVKSAANTAMMRFILNVDSEKEVDLKDLFSVRCSQVTVDLELAVIAFSLEGIVVFISLQNRSPYLSQLESKVKEDPQGHRVGSIPFHWSSDIQSSQIF